MQARLAEKTNRPINWKKTTDHLAQLIVVIVEICDRLLLPVFLAILLYMLISVIP